MPALCEAAAVYPGDEVIEQPEERVNMADTESS